MSDFARPVVETIAKRAANICSNPDCAALTSGPADDKTKAINVGEAAHIYGARPRSARFDPAMSEGARSDITNAVWLCRNCHKMVDADAAQFPAELLFEWRRAHEQHLMENLGKAGALLRHKVLQKRLAGFENCSYLAQQIVIDRPGLWEYKLTAELLRTLLLPTKLRWEALDKGLYALPAQVIDREGYLEWHRAQLDSVSWQVHAIAGLVNGELQRSWGPPGEAGSETEILRLCSLLAEACERILRWEETIRFVVVDEGFEEMQQLLVGVAGVFIQRLFEIPVWLSNIVSGANPTGTHELMLVFELPEGWVENNERAMKRAVQHFRSRA